MTWPCHEHPAFPGRCRCGPPMPTLKKATLALRRAHHRCPGAIRPPGGDRAESIAGNSFRSSPRARPRREIRHARRCRWFSASTSDRKSCGEIWNQLTSPSRRSGSPASSACRWSMCRSVSPTALRNVRCSCNPVSRCTNQLRGMSDSIQDDVTQKRIGIRQARKLWKSFQSSATSCFSFVESLGLPYIGKLLTDSLLWTRPVGPADDGWPDRQPDATAGAGHPCSSTIAASMRTVGSIWPRECCAILVSRAASLGLWPSAGMRPTSRIIRIGPRWIAVLAADTRANRTPGWPPHSSTMLRSGSAWLPVGSQIPNDTVVHRGGAQHDHG